VVAFLFLNLKGCERLKINEIVKDKQPDVHKKLQKKKKRKRRRRKENLSFNDFENMMKHDSYERKGGAIRQVRHG
jgi:D-ribose pyranose/furanose isomerase RbsD